MKTKLLFVLALFVFQFSFAHTKILTVPFLPSISPLTYCDSNNDGFGVFDLGAVTPIILAAQSSPASDYTISYHETMADAASGTNPITAPYNNINPFTQTIYYIIVQISSGDASIGSFQLIVNPAPEATVPGDYHLCDSNGAVGYEAFNLNTIVPEVLGSIDPSTVSVSFYTSLSDAEYGVNAIANASNYINTTVGHQTIYVRVAIISTGCYDVVTLHLFVDPLPQAMQPSYPEYVLCDSNAPIGYETFDLNSRMNSILMGQTGMTVTFYPSLADAQNGTNQISDPSNFTNIVIYAQTLGIRITNQATGCYTISTMDIRVAPLPQLIPPLTPYIVCDDNQDGAAVFDLTSLIPGLLGGQSYIITFHETLNDAETNGTTIPNPSSFMNINPFTQTIYARGEDLVTGCYSVVQVDLQVTPSPIAASMPSIVVCDIDSNPLDGVTSVDLTQQTFAIFALQPIAPSNFTVTFYTSLLLAQSGTAPIITASNFLGSNGQTIWYRVELNSTHCYNVGSFGLTVNTAPNIDLVSNNTLNTVYVDGSNNVVQTLTLYTQLIGNYSFEWEVDGAPIPGATSSVYTVNTASPTGVNRTFVVTATDLLTGCVAESSIDVIQSTGTPSPLGPIVQPYNPGETLAYLTIAGSNILWYAAASGKNATITNSTPLPLSTPLQNGATYYASQTIGGLESVARLPVTVYQALGIPGHEITSLQFAPNPVRDNLVLHSAVIIKSVSVYTILGQKVFEQIYNDANISIDLSKLAAGNYILKILGETGEKIIRIVKE